MILYKKKHTYTGKDGKQYKGWNFYLEENGNFVAIRASFSEDSRVLSMMAKEIVSD